ncbi:SDR family NAD(P)-dependent oxidoreductase [Streptomyces sp. NPDC008259]|uniref:SDR family NAD(P)-dependent oxidoreductase n=2 Tax=Streptomyces TaxID=1883 RepID=UPI0036E2502F
MRGPMSNSDEKLITALRASLKDNDRLRAQNRKLASASREPIAIVSMSCRFPGDVTSPEDLWRLVESGGDATTEFPENRGWDVEGVYDPDGSRPGTSYVNRGGFLHTADTFDAELFGISPNEALTMDPQQRLLLETSWEAFERAGIDPHTLKGSRTGVFAGMMYHDYVHNSATGSIASGRISYVFGFEGPSMTVDTACSSSLVSLHLAVKALRSGECTLALAGGVAVMATPEVFVEFSRQGGLAKDGRCKSFAGSTDGTSWAEGAGVLLLERLSDARRNGHPVLAVVRGSAVNQDGASNGLTAPNGPSQQRVIRAALADAQISADQVDVVEAHGTGTRLGDPIEAQALLATYGQGRPEGDPLWLGSLKSNLGHAQAAAGVGAVIKAVEAIRHGVMPRTLHVDEPTPEVDWEAGAVELLTEARAWPERGRPRRVGVSSFGLSGTNAHVIVEQAPEVDVPVGAAVPPVVVPVVLSGRSDVALSAQAERLLALVEKDGAELSLLDVGFSSVVSRAVLEHRAVVTAGDRTELVEGLRALAGGDSAANAVRGVGRSAGETAFLFTGQGAQRLGMGRELYEAYPVFAEAFDAVLAAVDVHLGRSLRDVVWGVDEGALNRTGVAQPALFAVEVALFRLAESWGVRPDFLAGHSVGEIAAAYVAGVLSLTDAAQLIVARGRLMEALPEGGAMVAVEATEAEVVPLLSDSVSIAAVNGPRSVVVSGAEDAVVKVADAFTALGRKSSRLRVSHAFHSPLMEPMLAEFAAVAEALTYAEPSLPLVSGVSGEVSSEVATAGYWVRHVREAVRFADCVSHLEARGVLSYVEVGPDGVLSGMAQQSVTSDAAVLVPLVRKGRAEVATAVSALARLHVSGVRVDWAAYYTGTGARRVDLPTYAFQRERYWMVAEQTGTDPESLGVKTADHPMLGAAVTLADTDETVLTGRLTLGNQPWVADHAVLGSVLLPGTAFVELAIRAADQVGCDLLEELTLQAPLVLTEQGGVSLQVVVGAADDSGRRSVAVYSSRDEADDDAWTRHAEGTLVRGAAAPADGLASWPPPSATAIGVDGAYELLSSRGYGYGPMFQGLTAAWTSGEELYAEVALPESAHADAERFGLHPALLDAAMHVALIDDGAHTDEATVLPFVWTDVALHASGATALRVRIAPSGQDSVTIRVADGTGQPVLTVGALVSRPVSVEQLGAGVGESLWEVVWRPLTGPSSGPSSWVCWGDVPAVGDVPGVVVFEAPTASGDVPDAVRSCAGAVLDVVRDWLADERCAGSRLVIVTRGAVDAGTGSGVVLGQAPVWGVVRAAQAEYPGRVVLVDADPGTDSDGLSGLGWVVASGEPEAALRGGGVVVPRLVRVSPSEVSPAEVPKADGVVLVTGGTGGLGALVARHLVTERGVRRLVLTSRRGLAAPGAEELVAELSGLGAEVSVAACDMADRNAVVALVAGLAGQLAGVVHAAGVGDNGLIASMDAARLDRVLGPKADGAWYLHEATRELDLGFFVMFSSAGGMVLAAGQANYAAANVFLDALAVHRRAQGLPATSLAYGLWSGEKGMGQWLREADLRRMRRQGLPALDPAEGLALFDAGLASGRAVVVPLTIDKAALRARTGTLPALLRDLAPPQGGRPAARAVAGRADASELLHRLTGLTDDERRSALLDTVCAHVARVLGHTSAHAVEPDRAFQELGFDSLSAVELRNQLNGTTGLRLPATLVFDYPNARAVADYIDGALDDELSSTPRASAPTTAPAARATDDDPIAVVAMSCRYPGGVNSPEDLWNLVAEGRDAVAGFPLDRGWDVAGVYDPEPGTPSKTYTKEGGFLHDAGDFDADLFGISPNEALIMDPQQRLLLEASWEVLERAGINPRSLKGSRTGVFAGLMYHDYGQGTEAAATTGGSLVSGRVSYTLGLEGPSLTVDTACSSSLVSLHLAAQALRSGECSLALAGGVAVMATPDMFVEFSRQRGLAPDGRCKSFAGAADGAAWSEGVGVLLVERLSDARKNGHPVLAVLRSSAVNQDGASNGMTAPNGPSQQRVIRAALENAGLTTADVDMVEAHGTGTRLGDPIEAQAVLATYGQGRPEGDPVWLGSLKSNLAHTQAAAGVGGVIKAVEAIRHGVMPKTLHVDEPTPQVDWEAGEVELLTEARLWPERERPRRVGVSSFGLSGTNAHVIVEQAPEVVEPVEAAVPPVVVPVVLSARGEAALSAQAGRLLALVEERAGLSLLDVGYSSVVSRAVLEHRAVVTAGDRTALVAGLRALADGGTSTEACRGLARTSGRTAFLFTGQGAQRLGMGRELYEAYPVFAEAFDAVLAEVDVHLGRSLRDVVWGVDEGALNRTGVAQPALFAVEVALFRLAESWGVRPDFLAGHSVGEIAAAHVAGVLSLPDAAQLIVARGRLMEALPEGGAMVAVEATEAEVVPLLSDSVSIAAVNGPRSVVVSGVEDAVVKVADAFTAQGRKSSRLRVSHAFHSPLMEPMLAEFEKVVSGLSFSAPKVPLVSGVTGEVSSEVATAGYWVRHVREAVRFADCVTYLEGQGVASYVEVGPDGVLSGMAQQSVTSDAAVLVPLVRKGRAEVTTAVSALARLHVSGVRVDWAACYAGTGARRVDLPTYAFQRRRFWLESGGGGSGVVGVGQGVVDHPLVGAVVSLPDAGGVLLTGRLSVDGVPWLADHAVFGRVLLPGTAFVELAVRAGDEVGCGVVEELTLQAPLVLPERGGVALQVAVGTADDTGRRTLSIHSRREDGSDDVWTRHAEGVVAQDIAAPPAGITEWPPPGATPLAVDEVYGSLLARGYGYGPVFQGLRAAWSQGGDLYAEVALPESAHADAERFGLHPALLDATMHALNLSTPQDGGGAEGGAALPFFWEDVRLHATGSTLLRVRLSGSSEDTISLTIADGAGAPVVSVGGLTLRPVSVEQLGAGVGESLWEVVWRPLTGPSSGPSSWVRWGDVPAVGDVPGVVVFEVPTASGDVPDAVRSCAGAVLDVVRDWLADERCAGSRLVIVTRGAVDTGTGLGVVLGQAPVWGVVRAAQAEYPGRVVLVDGDPDMDPDSDGLSGLGWVVASGEPEAALRGGGVVVPRLVRVSSSEVSPAEVPKADGVVLVTGGTGGLGALVARHLVTERGVRRLVLTSRRGLAAPGAEELVAELSGLGAEVSVVPCDVADREAVRDLVAGLAGQLAGVVHAAGVGDNGLIASMDAARLDRVLGPKADGAWYLHEATRELDLGFFVMFSSAGGMVLAAGQANYAAANVFLDALAVHRRARGLPATSLAYGLWSGEKGMGQWLREADLRRMRRQGLPALDPAEGLALFDAGLASGRAVVVPMTIDKAALRARTGTLPALLRDLAPAVRRPGASGAAAGTESEPLWQRIAHTPAAEQEAVLRALVRERAATLLGHSDSEALDPERDFLESGFDSLSAVELRNALMKDTGLRLPPMVVFDSKSPAALARLLHTELLAAPLDPTDPTDPTAPTVPTTVTGPATPITPTDPATDSRRNTSGPIGDTLRDLFHGAVVSGRSDKGFELLRIAADIRPGFTSADELDHLPSAVRLADGPGAPHLICLNSPMATGGAHQHARLVSHLQGRRKVSALPVPGFVAGESLPENADAAVQVIARSVLETAAGEPFVLLGYSAGGTLAYATAEYLERELGVRPAGVIMLDTFKVYDDGSADGGVPLDDLALGLFEKEAAFGRFDSSRLSAMGRWVQLVPDLAPEHVEAPVLFVQCTRSFVPDGDNPSPELATGRAEPWEPTHTLRTVDANHFTIVEDRAAGTAGVIEEWLDSGEVAAPLAGTAPTATAIAHRSEAK